MIQGGKGFTRAWKTRSFSRVGERKIRFLVGFRDGASFAYLQAVFARPNHRGRSGTWNSAHTWLQTISWTVMTSLEGTI